MKIDIRNLTSNQIEKLVELGLRSLIDKMDFANFPMNNKPGKHGDSTIKRTRLKWSKAHRAKFIATMKRKRLELKGQDR